MSSRRIKRPHIGVLPKKAISLFSGAGGDSLGLKRAGYDVVAFSEFNKFAISTHLKEFPNSKLLINPDTGSNDITKIPDSVFTPYLGKVDVLFAGFPCQSFSHAGKKKMDDPRSELVHEFVRVTKLIQPKWIIGENVSGLLSRKGKDPVTKEIRPVIDIITDLFRKIDYHITYKVVKATDFGVPQERKRLIIVGTKQDNKYPHMNWDKLLPGISERQDCIRPFLENHLEGAMEFDEKNIPDNTSRLYWIETKEEEPTGKPHPNLIRLVNGVRNKSSKEKKESSDENNQIITQDGLISFGVRKSAYHGQVLDPDQTSKTIICTYGTCPRLFVGLYNKTINKYWVRCLSVTELAQIQGFPKEYNWQGNEKEKIKQIGNAVPPPLCESIVLSLSTVILSSESQVSSMELKESDESDEDEIEVDE
jgi:DNA (cytosine-5)-methyltransferase 1